MSTVTGFVIGVVAAATITVLYAEQLGSGLGEAAGKYLPGRDTVVAATEAIVERAVNESPAMTRPTPSQPAAQEAARESPVPAQPELTLEQRWKEYAIQANTLKPAGEYPWRSCFQRAAASYELPETLLLAIASGESNFDPAARSDKDAIGLMQIRWPQTSRHLGVNREADLYDPCTNVDAGARYVAELAGKFEQNLHLVVAAYNYGPGRINGGDIPEGARWYSQYIYQHLQQVLGEKHVATSALISPSSARQGGYEVLMRFNGSNRARDFIGFLKQQVPHLNLQQQSEALGQHEVVLLYQDDRERLRALDAIRDSGIATLMLDSQLDPQNSPQQYDKQSL